MQGLFRKKLTSVFFFISHDTDVYYMTLKPACMASFPLSELIGNEFYIVEVVKNRHWSI